MNDPLEQLAAFEVPAPPPEFDRQLHGRLNRRLIAQHVTDLLLHAMPWALLQLGQALLGLMRFSLSGRFDDERRKSEGPGARDQSPGDAGL
jgi:hypothetical protein